MKEKEKEFGRLSRRQVREIFALSHQAHINLNELRSLVAESHEKMRAIVDSSGSWGELYEIPVHVLFVLLMESMGLYGGLQLALKDSDDIHQSFLDFFNEESDDDLDVPEEDYPFVFVLSLVLMKNFEATRHFGLSISQMVERVARGDDDLLFTAVICDRSVVQAEPIAARISLAELLEDESFMALLAKAITKTRPALTKRDFDDTRFILSTLQESIGLENIPNKTIDELIADDLEALPGRNSFDRLSKLITQFRNLYRK